MNIILRAVLALVLACAPLAASAQLAFQPYGIGTATASATTTTSATALVLPTVPARRMPVRIYNAGTVAVFILFGTSGVAATTGNMPIAPGSVEVLTVPEGTTHVGAITATGTASVYFTAGEVGF